MAHITMARTLPPDHLRARRYEILVLPNGTRLTLPLVESTPTKRSSNAHNGTQNGWGLKPAAFSVQVPAPPAEMDSNYAVRDSTLKGEAPRNLLSCRVTVVLWPRCCGRSRSHQ